MKINKKDNLEKKKKKNFRLKLIRRKFKIKMGKMRKMLKNEKF